MERDYSKFFTPDHIAAYMVGLLTPKTDCMYLEPHAGNGRLVRQLKFFSPESIVLAIEKNDDHFNQLMKIADNVAIRDFLDINLSVKFDGCIANPPFGNGVDLKAHLNKMIELMNYNSPIVTILPFDFQIPFTHQTFNIENWSRNSDGTITKIKIVKFFTTK